MAQLLVNGVNRFPSISSQNGIKAVGDIETYKTSGDANPTIKLDAQNSEIILGPGGATPLQTAIKDLVGPLVIQQKNTNTRTALYLMPNSAPTGDTAELRIFATDYIADNINYAYLTIKASQTDYRILVGRAGTGSKLPLIFDMGGVESFRIKTDGDIQIDAARKLWFGTDVNLYRYYTNILKTDNYLFAYIIATNGGFFPRVTLSNDGRALVESALADSVNTLRNSPAFVARARYWNGTSSASRDAFIFHRMLSATPTSEIVLQIAGVDYLRVGDNGIIAHRDILPSADASINIGSDTLRINNVRAVTVTTGDLVLRSDRARWRIVEEHDGIYAINENTGKRYRIMLQEVG